MPNSSDIRLLREDEFSIWDTLVAISPQGSVFCYSWWLKEVTGHFHVLGYFENGILVAGMPLFFKRRFFLSLLTMPKLTQTWGVLIEPLSGKKVKVASKEMEILRVFADELSKYPIFIQSFHPTLQNWLPFYWRGFKQMSRFTYLLDDLTDLDRVMKEFRENIRTDIRKAQKRGIFVEQASVSQAYPIFKKSFDRQQIKLPYTREYLCGLYTATKKHDAGECFVAKDSAGNINASAFMVWDRQRAYYLVGGGDPDLRNSGATSLLIWNLIQFAAGRTQSFDFEGSVIEPIERFFRAFGARQVVYNSIYRLPKTLELIKVLTDYR